MFQALAMSAQLRVEVPGVVSLDEQFNVTFVYEGENSPSGFEWSPGDDFQLVWGPQQGRSRARPGRPHRSMSPSSPKVLPPRAADNSLRDNPASLRRTYLMTTSSFP